MWPEEALRDAVYPEEAARIERGALPPVLTGLPLREPGTDALYNGAVVLGAPAAGVYRKVDVMPFGESVPFAALVPGLRAYFPNTNAVARAAAPAGLVLGAHRIAVRICYEEVLDASTRDAAVAIDPHLLVGLSNDTWFGPTPAAAMHLALARFRAIEHRRWFVRAANEGPSVILDARGYVRARTAAGVPAAAAGEARFRDDVTPYRAYGAAPVHALLAALALAAALRRAPRASRSLFSRRSRRPEGDGQPRCTCAPLPGAPPRDVDLLHAPRSGLAPAARSAAVPVPRPRGRPSRGRLGAPVLSSVDEVTSAAATRAASAA